MKKFKAKFEIYRDVKKLKESLNYVADLQDKKVIKVISCYPRNGYMYLVYEAEEKLIKYEEPV